ncbi:MAG: hypothetical protein HKN85_13045 [Gammaproteobacteria bacterium]|nr:hypothetical protein [Gammaproteobacteria bacterium]
MKYSSISAVLAVLCLVHMPAFAAEPVGFERWTPLSSSFVEFDHTCRQLQEKYNYPDFFGPYNPDRVKEEKDFRLIDIEVRSDISLGHAYDAVVVTNSGSFNRKSWLACDLSLTYVRGLAQSKSMVILDIERYTKGGKTVYAAILQLHEFSLDTMFIPSARLSDINAIAGNDEDDSYMRVIDIDHVGYINIGCPGSSEEACDWKGEPLYSAVLVENSGDNHILWNLEDGWGDGAPLDNLVTGAYQLVDRELTRVNVENFEEKWHSAMLSVAIDQDYHTLENLSKAQVHAANHGSQGVIVDLEWDIVWENPEIIPGVNNYDWYVVTAKKF